MKALAVPLKHKLTIILLSALSMSFSSVMAKSSDKMTMADVQKAREMARMEGNHSKHIKKPVDKSQEFRGVYYGYLPCRHCAGIKMTLSLKNKSNYLLVTQYAQASTKEFYEKGKYTWDDKTGLVTLVARKDAKVRELRIKNDGALIMLSFDGVKAHGDRDGYTLLRSDKSNSREVHIH
jgi:uncharacterized lipoprotein NlpE involved in copper resistance